jgi:structural maintenance of chromosome 1
VRGAQELREKQLNLTTQRSKVENQLLFERQQLEELQHRFSRLEQTLAADASEIESKNAEKVEYLGKLQKIQDNMARMENQVSELKAKEEAQEKLVEEKRKSLSQKGQEVDKMMKFVTDMETAIEKLHAERMSIFRKCKLEEINIPLNQGSMEDVPMDDSEVNGPSYAVCSTWGIWSFNMCVLVFRTIVKPWISMNPPKYLRKCQCCPRTGRLRSIIRRSVVI